jgi:hypothetical protein
MPPSGIWFTGHTAIYKAKTEWFRTLSVMNNSAFCFRGSSLLLLLASLMVQELAPRVSSRQEHEQRSQQLNGVMYD